MPFRAGLAVLAVAAGSCRAPRPCAAVPSTTVQPAPRRDQCLAPPWALDPARPEAGVPGWSAAVCTDGYGHYVQPAERARRSSYFIHGGARTISGPEAKGVLEATRGAGSSSGLGGCCSPAVARKEHVLCLKFWSDVCRLPISRIVQAVDDQLKRRGLEDVRVGVEIDIDGPVGPRCEPRDPTCGPISSREWDRPDAPRSTPAGCVAGRVRVAAPDEMTPGRACVHDGECSVGACGAQCVRWDQLPGQMWCEDVERLEKPPVTYCGCVSGRCDWFRPAAE
jgi:hypothetical protein